MSPRKKARSGDRLALNAADNDAERERICDALVELIAERGYPDATLDGVLERAGIAPKVFARHYVSLEACFADVWQGHTQEFFERALAAYRAEATWRDGMRAQAWELHRFLAEDPIRARICLVEVNFGGDLVQASRDVFMNSYADLIDRGRYESPRGSRIPRARAEAIVGAIWEKAALASKGGPVDNPELVPQILHFVVLQYLGPEAAQEELQRGSDDVQRYRRGEI